MVDISAMPLEDVVNLAAVDDDFYGHCFFPKTFRQQSPGFSQQLANALDDPAKRYVAVKMFRGSAKTTRLRVKVSKLIAYGVSPLTLFVSNTQRHSIYSLKWIRKQVEFNSRWANTFGLVRGKTWTEEIIEVFCTITGQSLYVVALGITGQIRGVNIDDLRPTYIVLDDPDNEETTATPEQREKTAQLTFGALQNSLVPESENPNAKMVLLQTPSASKEDLVSTCFANPAWAHLEVSCFNQHGESTWPDRFPVEFLAKEKANYVYMNRLSIWLREMEVRVVSAELASFKAHWLQYYDLPPDEMTCIIAIDPASSDSPTADDQVIGALGFHVTPRGVHLYVLDYTAERGEMPDVAATKFMDYLQAYRPRRAAVETVQYQKMLSWYLQKTMKEQRRYIPVDEMTDRRKKSDRILQALLPYAAYGRLHVKKSMTKLIEQFTEYSPLYKGHDDVLDMLAIGVMSYENTEAYIEGEFENVHEDERSIPQLADTWRKM